MKYHRILKIALTKKYSNGRMEESCVRAQKEILGKASLRRCHLNCFLGINRSLPEEWNVSQTERQVGAKVQD